MTIQCYYIVDCQIRCCCFVYSIFLIVMVNQDSEQFDEDDMCSMATDEGGSRKDDWDGWDGERERSDDNQLDASLGELISFIRSLTGGSNLSGFRK